MNILREYRDSVLSLHTHKDALYKDSWCRRGELMSIFPNILRKSDRISAACEIYRKQQEFGQELSQEEAEALSMEAFEDTVLDLTVYLCKYQVFLSGEGNNPSKVNEYIGSLPDEVSPGQTESIQSRRSYLFLERVASFINGLADEAGVALTSGDSKAKEDFHQQLRDSLPDLILELWDVLLGNVLYQSTNTERRCKYVYVGY